MIVQELTRIQHIHGWLPASELLALSKRTSVPLHRIHEVASFYPLYRLEPPPRADVRVCRDMACHINGAAGLQEKFEAIARQKGEQALKVCGVSCLGQCDRPVAVDINDYVYFGKTESELTSYIETALAGKKLQRQHADRTPLPWKIDVYKAKPEYRVIRELATGQRKPEQVLDELKTAGLRGMGGAGFPTSIKWTTVRGAPETPKYVVCNADESEPGTFKDRELMRRAPHLVIEGIIMAGLVTGAEHGWIYVRHEFEEEIEAVKEEIERAEHLGACGDNVFGSGRKFPVEVFVSPGGYVQGEESALLEAMEDRRGEPRNKPPFPVFSGLYSKPTVINNVETLSWTPGIVLNGGKWYAGGGTHGATGMRFVSISGDVNRPGVYEVPFGQTVRELIVDTAGGVSGGRKLKAIAPSGPSGGFLPAALKAENVPPAFAQKWFQNKPTFDIYDLPLDLNTVGSMNSMLGAAFIVYDERRDMVENALNCVQFYRNESCGKCVPCRMGSQKLSDMIADMLAGKFTRAQLPAVTELAQAMVDASICGLGQVAANPISMVIKHFPEELNKYVR
jgi:NADH:ubiquinone oxidoreductase subunit F (NADH-binding)/NADH:ubiquinone oxidoreductase subunit E